MLGMSEQHCASQMGYGLISLLGTDKGKLGEWALDILITDSEVVKLG